MYLWSGFKISFEGFISTGLCAWPLSFCLYVNSLRDIVKSTGLSYVLCWWPTGDALFSYLRVRGCPPSDSVLFVRNYQVNADKQTWYCKDWAPGIVTNVVVLLVRSLIFRVVWWLLAAQYIALDLSLTVTSPLVVILRLQRRKHILNCIISTR